MGLGKNTELVNSGQGSPPKLQGLENSLGEASAPKASAGACGWGTHFKQP